MKRGLLHPCSECPSDDIQDVYPTDDCPGLMIKRNKHTFELEDNVTAKIVSDVSYLNKLNELRKTTNNVIVETYGWLRCIPPKEWNIDDKYVIIAFQERPSYSFNEIDDFCLTNEDKRIIILMIIDTLTQMGTQDVTVGLEFCDEENFIINDNEYSMSAYVMPKVIYDGGGEEEDSSM